MAYYKRNNRRARVKTAMTAAKPATVGASHSTPEEWETAKVYAMLDPDWFCDHVLRSPNDPWQSEVMRAVADAWKKRIGLPTEINHTGKDKITVRAMHGPGKTHLAAKCMHWFNFVFHGRIVCTAPKQQQLHTRLWPEFYRVLNGSIAEYRLGIDYKATRIKWNKDETWYAVAETGSKPENIAGHHDEFMLVVVDEASGVHEEMFPQIEAAQSSGKLVIILLIGNPTRTTGTFWASHKQKKVTDQYFAYHITLDKAPRVKKEYVQNQIDKYGINSPVVKVRCFGEFAEMEVGQLMALEWLEQAKGRDLPTGWENLRYRIRISVDVADGGVDETVYTIARHYEGFVYIVKQIRKSWESSVAPIEAGKYGKTLWEEYGCSAERGDDFVVDAIGVGAGTAGHLMVTEQLPVIAYKGGEASDDTLMWRNRRCQSYLVARNGLRDGWVYIAEEAMDSEVDWMDFLGQLCSIRRKEGTERVEDLETKAELLKRITKSPDMADSFAMQFATQRPTMGNQPGEAILANAVYTTSRHLEGANLDFGTGPASDTIGGSAADLDWG